jgi:hypothetical protein
MMKNQMRRFIAGLALITACAATSPTAHAAARHHTGEGSNTAHAGQFGLGVVLGEPTGLSAKYWLNSNQAVDFGLAYSFNDFVYIFADYLFHFPHAFGASTEFVSQLNPYVGIGGVFLGSTVSNRNDNRYFTSGGSSAGLGLRLPLGIEWRPARPPLGIFVELVPGIGIIPSTFGFFEGGIGVRYYF